MRSVLVILCFLALPVFGWAQSGALYLKEAQKLYEAQNYGKAAEYFSAAVKWNPKSALAYQGLGNCRYHLGDKSGALEAFEKALEIDPTNAELSTFANSLRLETKPSPTPVISVSALEAEAKPKDPTFTLDLLGGAGLSNVESYGFGYGGSLRALFLLEKNFGVGATVGYHQFKGLVKEVSNLGASGTVRQTYRETNDTFGILATAKCSFGKSEFKPYAVAGLGAALLMISSQEDIVSTVSGIPSETIVNPDTSTLHPMGQAGAGVEYSLDKDVGFFAEIKADLILLDGGLFLYVPLSVGASFLF